MPGGSGEENSNATVESLPVNARGRSALCGCAKAGGNKRLLSHLELFFWNFISLTSSSTLSNPQALISTFDSRLLRNSWLAASELCRTSHRPLFQLLHKKSPRSHAPQEACRDRGLAGMHRNHSSHVRSGRDGISAVKATL